MPSPCPDPEPLDVAVVGAGPAGLAAGIHLARAGLTHKVFEAGQPGGLLRSAGLVECYPGFPGGVSALDLVRAMVAQARGVGVCLREGRVVGLSRTGARYQIETGLERWLAAAVILATGTRPRLLEPSVVEPGVPPERVQYVTAALPEVLEGQRVWVSGAGDAAFDSALQLVARGARVELGMRGQAPRGMALLVQRALDRGVSLSVGARLCTVGAGERTLRLGLDTPAGPTAREVDWLLVCHGRDPDLTLWHRLAGSAARGPREVECRTPGLFMAGDLIRGECRYAAVAAGDGLRCARLAEAHLERYRAGPSTPSPGSS